MNGLWHVLQQRRAVGCAVGCAVSRGGFFDKNGVTYNPNMVRLGSEEALSSAAQEVSEGHTR